ncbi:MAG: hypothetical protein JO086_11290 [Acidimicrobiia bacterium]|nr:hypothetical protein [Acidimicrobiia bacterium]
MTVKKRRPRPLTVEGRLGTQLSCPDCGMKIVDASGKPPEVLLERHRERQCPGVRPPRSPVLAAGAKRRRWWRRA